MGSTFSNIIIMKNKNNYSEVNVKRCLNAIIVKNTEATFAITADPTSNWFTIYSDIFDNFDSDELGSYGTLLSGLFKSPTLCTSCFDSRYNRLYCSFAEKIQPSGLECLAHVRFERSFY